MHSSPCKHPRHISIDMNTFAASFLTIRPNLIVKKKEKAEEKDKKGQNVN